MPGPVLSNDKRGKTKRLRRDNSCLQFAQSPVESGQREKRSIRQGERLAQARSSTGNWVLGEGTEALPGTGDGTNIPGRNSAEGALSWSTEGCLLASRKGGVLEAGGAVKQNACTGFFNLYKR